MRYIISSSTFLWRQFRHSLYMGMYVLDFDKLTLCLQNNNVRKTSSRWLQYLITLHRKIEKEAGSAKARSNRKEWTKPKPYNFKHSTYSTVTHNVFLNWIPVLSSKIETPIVFAIVQDFFGLAFSYLSQDRIT
jgi:hypothetical protein